MKPLVEVGTDYVRERYVGGSDIAGILGVSPWATPVQVYDKKTRDNTGAPISGSKAKLFKRGKRWEAVVGEMLIEELEQRGHTVEIIRANKRYKDSSVPYFAAEIDYEIKLDGGADIVNVELKTVHPNATKEWGESDTDIVPVQYAAQVMWGLGVTNRNLGILAPLFGADELRVYPILSDAETIAGMRERATRFWETNVLPKNPPPASNLEDMARLFPKEFAGKKITPDADLQQHLLEYRALEARVDAAMAERDLAEFKIKRVMADAEFIVNGDGKTIATWKARPWTSLDQVGLKEAYPKVHKEFVRKGEARVFTVRKTQE